MAKMSVNGDVKAAVHLALQGKGGVGKSLICSILAQYFRQKQRPVQCLDADPVNATLAQYNDLHAERINLLKHGTINEKQFDLLVEKVCSGEGVFIIDSQHVSSDVGNIWGIEHIIRSWPIVLETAATPGKHWRTSVTDAAAAPPACVEQAPSTGTPNERR